ncbi:hypothetical protein B0H13DRAFT_1888149 [Mycena leptocephala]|nr:hypothetical protein B0H13DRAFT_1888149 [Mycena leptocephala]
MIFDNDSIQKHEEDEDNLPFKDTKLRIIICMSLIASRHLLEHGRYLQSDIAFKRIVNFLEFEMTRLSMKIQANISDGATCMALISMIAGTWFWNGVPTSIGGKIKAWGSIYKLWHRRCILKQIFISPSVASRASLRTNIFIAYFVYVPTTTIATSHPALCPQR